ncbi:four-carbon acid sugar kinase family protein [Breoghania sp. JC706]|uniref:four-carbon acid sugar kinase family protein n=1 Tax=Breoghania sp. JC706 TaxID=3117732 RepID=UPI00300BAFCD
MARVLIIADDLTGALDSSVAFAERGLRVVVALDTSRLPDALAAAPDVVAVSTGSREMSEEAASAAVSRVCDVVGRFSGIVMKKVDSRLKGPVAAEVDTLSASMPRPVLAAPAIPRLGRLVVDGAVTGTGVDAPIDVATALNRPAEIPDIRTDADFDEALPDDLEGTLFVGAAGLAEAIARRLAGDPAIGGQAGEGVPESGSPVLAKPVLAAIGSRDPVTLRQIAALDKDALVIAPNGAVPEVRAAPLVVVQMAQGDDAIAPREAENRFSGGVCDLVGALKPATLFACGGESAAAILRRLGVGLLELKGEALPGIPVSRALDGAVGLDVVTKSGGFGMADTLVRLFGAPAQADLAGADGAAVTVSGRDAPKIVH